MIRLWKNIIIPAIAMSTNTHAIAESMSTNASAMGIITSIITTKEDPAR